jgi:hypothetical protein
MGIYQGIIELRNYAVIENARVGIATGIFDVNGNWNWNSFGGIIRAANSKFLNNKKDIEFMSYSYQNNQSYFNNCLFEVNRLLANGALPSARMSMLGVKNVNIKGCTFRYAAGNVYPVAARGTGIFTIDAKYNVGDFCTTVNVTCPVASTVRSTFEGLDYGIYSQNSNALMNPNIYHAKFINNSFGGARLVGIHYSSFNDCEVQVGTEYQSYGIANTTKSKTTHSQTSMETPTTSAYTFATQAMAHTRSTGTISTTSLWGSVQWTAIQIILRPISRMFRTAWC